jgi:hypothetical protein
MLMRVSTKCPFQRQKFLRFKIKHLQSQPLAWEKEFQKFFWEFFVHNHACQDAGNATESIIF